MLDEYRIESMSVGQYLDEVDNENIKIDQAVQRDEKADETIWQARKEEEIRISVLNMIYREFRVI